MALRDLLVSFGFEVDTTELKKGEHHADSLLHRFEAMGKSLAGVFLAHEAKEFFESTINGARELARSAIIFGMPAEKLQELEHAADMADVSAGTLHMGLMRLQRSMSAAGEGGGELGKVFKDLGIELKADGKGKDTVDLLSEIADQVKKVEDPAKRTAIAMKIFGRGGAQLAPLLAQGSEGIERLREEVKELGGGYSEELLEQSEHVEDATKRLNFQMKSLRGSIVTGMIPAALGLLGGMRWLVERFTKLDKSVSLARVAMAGLFGFVLLKLPAAIALVSKFAIGSGLAVAKWLLLWAVVDDIIGLFTGADSEIGAILDSVFGEGAAEAFVSAIKYMTSSWEGFKDTISTGLFELGGMVYAAWLGIKHSAIEAFASIADAWDRMVGALKLPGWLNKALGGGTERNTSGHGWREQAEEMSRQENLALAEDLSAAAREWQARKEEAGGAVGGSTEGVARVGTTTGPVASNYTLTDQSIINVTTLPATSATQAREVGRAVAKARSQHGDNRATLAATEHRVEK